MLVRIPVCVACAAMLAGCGGSSGPTSPSRCTTAITIGRLSNGSPVSPGQGLAWTTYFQATLLPARPAVFIVDINSSPPGCLAGWTAVSADTSVVQLSPSRGTGRGQVELFITPNTGAQRSTVVTIAEQSVVITQSAG
jgi:hypothetical protein